MPTKSKPETNKPKQRLAGEARRQAMLDAARAILREEGFEAVTLARVAEQTGVSKPIAYNHFGTLTGLFLAVYRANYDEQSASLRNLLDQPGQHLEQAAATLSRSLMACYGNPKGEWRVLGAMLQNNRDMQQMHQELLADYTNLVVAYIGQAARRRGKALRLACTGILGAADAIAGAALRGEVDRAQATRLLTGMIVALLT